MQVQMGTLLPPVNSVITRTARHGLLQTRLCTARGIGFLEHYTAFDVLSHI